MPTGKKLNSMKLVSTKTNPNSQKGGKTMATREETNSTKIPGPTEGVTNMKSPKLLARIAGVFYLLVGITGAFSEGYVDPSIYVGGDAAATARNVLANPELVRIGVFAHLVDATFFVLMALTLYQLLNHVNKGVARSMLVGIYTYLFGATAEPKGAKVMSRGGGLPPLQLTWRMIAYKPARKLRRFGSPDLSDA
jgi:hypothetical protein